jgi:hypothetical protein
MSAAAAAAAAAAALRQMRLLLGMLNASPWRYYPLTLQFLAAEHSILPRGEQSAVGRLSLDLCRAFSLKNRGSSSSGIVHVGQ